MADESTEFSQFIAAADTAEAPAAIEAPEIAAVDEPIPDTETDPGAPPDPEDAKPEPPAKTPDQEKAAAKFALLAKRDLALRQKETVIRSREARLAKLEEFAQQVSTEEGAIAWLETRDPKLYEKWTRRIVGQSQAPDPNDIAQQALREVQMLKQRDAQREAQLDEANTKSVLAQHQLAINQTIASDDRYGLIAAYEAERDVMATIEAYWAQTQKVLTIEEAADIVEGALKKKHERAINGTRSKAKTDTANGTEPATASSGKRSPQTQTQKTVTQRMRNTAPRAPADDSGAIDDRAWQRHLKRLGI